MYPILIITKLRGIKSPLLFYMQLKETLTLLAKQAALDNGCQLVEFQLKGNQQQQKLVILIDNEAGVSIEECAKVSHQLDDLIEAQSLIPNAYTLEVSSPGIDIPLTEKWQYEKNLGRKLTVTLLTGIEKEGKLTQVTENQIVLEGQGKPGKVKKEDKIIQISYDQIKQSKVQVSFN